MQNRRDICRRYPRLLRASARRRSLPLSVRPETSSAGQERSMVKTISAPSTGSPIRASKSACESLGDAAVPLHVPVARQRNRASTRPVSLGRCSLWRCIADSVQGAGWGQRQRQTGPFTGVALQHREVSRRDQGSSRIRNASRRDVSGSLTDSVRWTPFESSPDRACLIAPLITLSLTCVPPR